MLSNVSQFLVQIKFLSSQNSFLRGEVIFEDFSPRIWRNGNQGIFKIREIFNWLEKSDFKLNVHLTYIDQQHLQ